MCGGQNIAPMQCRVFQTITEKVNISLQITQPCDLTRILNIKWSKCAYFLKFTHYYAPIVNTIITILSTGKYMYMHFKVLHYITLVQKKTA